MSFKMHLQDLGRHAALTLMPLLMAGCSSDPAIPGAIHIKTGHEPGYTKSQTPVTVAIAQYIPMDKRRNLYKARPGTRVRFTLPAYYLVSEWNLLGGDQESIVIELNSRTLRPWQDCLGGTINRPVSICPTESPLLVRIWSDIRPAIPLSIKPTLASFPDDIRSSFYGREVYPVDQEDGLKVVGYKDIWSTVKAKSSAKFGDVDLYSSSLFLYPVDFKNDQVKFVDCEKMQDFCKAYFLFRGHWVEFQLDKERAPEVRRYAAGISRLLSTWSR